MIKFDINVEERVTTLYEIRLNEIPVFKGRKVNVPYIIVTTNSFPHMEDIDYIVNELYLDIVDLGLKYNNVGLIINPDSLNLEVLINDDTILDEVAENLKKRYFNKVGFGEEPKKTSPLR